MSTDPASTSPADAFADGQREAAEHRRAQLAEALGAPADTTWAGLIARSKPAFTPAQARDILAWIDTLDRHRTFDLVRRGSDGYAETSAFLAKHPDGQASMDALCALAAMDVPRE